MPSLSKRLQLNIQVSGKRSQQADVVANGSADFDRTEDRSINAHVGDDELMTEVVEPVPTTGKPIADELSTTTVSASLSPGSILAEEHREDSEEEGSIGTGLKYCGTRGRYHRANYRRIYT